MIRSLTIKLGALLSACLLFACTMNIAGGGNSSGTGNGAVVTAASDRITGATKPMAKVRLFSQDWMPVLDTGTFSDSSMADDSGKFVFANIPHGYYNLIVFSADQKSSGIFQNIPCQPAVAWADTIDTLKEPGYLQGFLTSAQNDTLALSYIYVRGTPYYFQTGSNGRIFTMGPLPPARFTMQIYGLYTTNGNHPVQAVQNTMTQNSNVGGSINDSVTVTIYPDSIVQLTR
ncbi:MAG: hypothetical protein PHC61_05040 [Chitinivibrionales bacterium]|nr:hypothetical protein [Chitinivibrionales bacterium]